MAGTSQQPQQILSQVAAPAYELVQNKAVSRRPQQSRLNKNSNKTSSIAAQNE